MTARFRIRVAGGGEFALDTLDAFVQKVQAGDIGPDDLVFDGLTGGWVPAWSHPAYQLSADPLVAEDGAEPPIQLVDVEEPSPEEEARAFIARMEEERRAEEENRPNLGSHLTLVGPESDTLSGIMPPSTPPHPRAREHEGRSAATAPPRARQHPRRSAPTVPPFNRSTARRRGKRPHRTSVPTRPRWGRWAWWAGVSAVLCVGLAATATVAWSALRSGGWFFDRGSDADTREARPVVATEASLRQAAFDGFVNSLNRLRVDMGVGAVPSMWLEGRYLADPLSYPQVREYWERYLRFVESAHQGEVELYRNAYLNVAEQAGIGGPIRSLRAAGAASDFESGSAARDSLYARVWKLAAEAVSLDSTLDALEGRVSYEPLRGERLSADPVIEAAGTDPEAQAELEQALDRVLMVIAPLQNGERSREGARARAPTWLIDSMKRLAGR